MRLAQAFTTAMLAAAMLASPGAARADVLIDNVLGQTPDGVGAVRSFGAVILTDDGRVKELLGAGDKRPKKKKLNGYYDAGGQLMLPGLVDGYIDMGALMSFALGLDLHGADDVFTVMSRLDRFAADNPNRNWLVGQGWTPGPAMAGLSAATIDRVAPGRAVILFDAGGGRAVASSRALELLKLDGDGRLSSEALDSARERMPAFRAAERDVSFDAAQQQLLSAGVTGLSDMGTDMADWHVYRRAGDEGRLHLRISAYADDVKAMEAIAGPAPTPWLYGDRLRLTGVLLAIDGPGQAGAIWLAHPPEGADAAGPKMRDAELKNKIVRAALDDFAVAIAAYGDAAVDEALLAIDEVAPTFEDKIRWRIVGLQLPPSAGPAALVPYRLTVDAPGGTPGWQQGLAVAEGSFAPIHQPAALGRGLDPRALAARTLLPARAAEMGGFTGSLMPGKWADFILLTPPGPNEPPFAGRVNETWIGGRPAWRREAEVAD